MKKILLLLLFTIPMTLLAQVPQGISYQAIALNSTGNPVVNANIGLRLTLLDNSSTGTVLYSETQTKTTTAQGLYNLVIGQGSATLGTFTTINWGANTKFLKVEIDIAGGTNYVLVGSTQLLSVPYAFAADSLVTSAGEGITLVSPNGTPYLVTVNDSGQLSLPTSNAPASSTPTNFYLYGTFNSFNPTTALLMDNFFDNFNGTLFRSGYKYLTAGTELKFLATNTASSPIYGTNLSNGLQVNGSSYLVSSTGYYLVDLYNSSPPNFSLEEFTLSVGQLTPVIRNALTFSAINGTYSAATNKFSFIVSISANNSASYIFEYDDPKGNDHGDNLADGSVESNGTPITINNTTSSPKNFRVELTINFNGSASCVIVPL